jgi:hypothetical protein
MVTDGARLQHRVWVPSSSVSGDPQPTDDVTARD